MPDKLRLYQKRSNIQIRKDENGNETRTITGVIPFNSESVLISDWWDEYVEIIAPSAFNKTLADRAEVKAFVNHDDGRIIGSTDAETMRLHTEEDGLHFEIDTPDTADGDYAYKTIRSGNCQTLSFGFFPVKYTEEVRVDDKGEKTTYRTLTEVKLVEISVCVAFPAYPEGGTEARSIMNECNTNFEELKNMLCRSEKLSDTDKVKLNSFADKLHELTRSAEQTEPINTQPNTEPEVQNNEEAEKETALRERKQKQMLAIINSQEN